jgi:uncharacterized membrane protein
MAAFIAQQHRRMAMRKTIAAALWAAALALAVTPMAFAKGTTHRTSHASAKSGFSGSSAPPGWSHGRKTGWGGGNMPPGLRR